MAVTKRRCTMTSRAQKAQAMRDAAMRLYRLAQTTVQTVLRAYGSGESALA
ncbi:MAG TPA: hypothetical protein VFN37_09015 [Candidatus Baltobacteraceae bacterium]|nr:hypothetical protein [Candidatus Baltobacteraceae bacterium]